MNNRITREFEDEGIIIYRRCGSPTQRGFLKKYFLFDKKQNQSLGNEFISKSQVVSFLKEAHII